MNIPTDLRYTKDHEWVRIQENMATIGITDYAQSELGDIVFVELPEVNTSVKKGGVFGTLESVKAVSDIYTPVSGVITKINDQLEDEPELVNQNCYDKAWMIVIRMDDPAEITALMDASAYEKYAGAEAK
ncbi:MAG: glycine cleavage system protein GcvH [Thermodesulfobacteriota bacterium]|nr:glycine cleavage system protein GcvH [Thermodesulfobacteriota bacterium]